MVDVMGGDELLKPQARMKNMQVEAVTLEGPRFRLEPLGEAHHATLCAVGLDDELWRWTPKPVRNSRRHGRLHRLRAGRAGRRAGAPLRHRRQGDRAGDRQHALRGDRADPPPGRDRLDLAGPSCTSAPAANTEAKYLLLRHAFETLGCIRVELKTDALNERSRAAIRRIGAREEGTLRNHMITASGRVRDTVYYSILDAEWPEVKEGLERPPSIKIVSMISAPVD